MKEFSVADLAQIVKARLDTGRSRKSSISAGRLTAEHQVSSIKQVFTGISTDSRTTQAGDCFFAIPGENFDGHDYICDAFDKGAVCAVVSKATTSADKPLLRVNDTVKALGDLAREYRQQAGFKVVAITGSVGKTMTRQIVYHVLSHHFRVFQSPKNYNNQIGLPLTLLGADPMYQIVIAELGSNHPGEIAYLTCIAQPDIAVVTNVYPSHLEGFVDLQTIMKEKLSISEGLSKDGVLIINTDVVKWLNGNRLNYQLPITNNQVVTFGKSDGSDYQVRNVAYNGTSCSFTINGTKIYLPVLGMGNVENALAAWAVCCQFGLTIDDFSQAVKTLQTLPMRAELLQIGTLTVLNDCYNANPASMKNALDILRHLDPDKKRRLVFICGDMAELGQYAQVLHAELGTSIARARVQVLLAVGKFAKVAAEAAKRTADYNLQTICFEDTPSACNNLPKFIKDYDIILVKGSRVAKLELAVERLKRLFG